MANVDVTKWLMPTILRNLMRSTRKMHIYHTIVLVSAQISSHSHKRSPQCAIVCVCQKEAPLCMNKLSLGALN